MLVLAGIGVDRAWMGFNVFDMLGWAGVITGSKSNCCLVELGLWGLPTRNEMKTVRV